MKVKATLFYSDDSSQEFSFEIDYVQELYDAMNDEVEKLSAGSDGIPVTKWSRATIEIDRSE